jgi:hypothetical protein
LLEDALYGADGLKSLKSAYVFLLFLYRSALINAANESLRLCAFCVAFDVPLASYPASK